MLLIDQPPLPADTAIVFDVKLEDGSRPIKAEARVTGSVQAMDGRPEGLRVRFKRYGAPTKAFIDRAMAFVATGEDSLPPPPEPDEPSTVLASAPDAATMSPLTLDALPFAGDRRRPEPARAPHTVDVAAPSTLSEAGSFRPVAVTPSGSPDVPGGLAALRARAATMPETPANREYLLEKLRQRGLNDELTSRYVRPQ